MEYLFRGKYKNTNEWVYGSLLGDSCIVSRNQSFEIEGNHIYNTLKAYDVIPETVGIRIENEGFYVGDILRGKETDEYGSVLSAWTGIVKYNPDKSRIMIQDDLEDWYEVDDFMYDEVVGTIFDKE